MMKKLLLCLLAMLMILTCFSSCKDDLPPEEETQEETEEPAAPTHDENGYELDSLPTLDFGNCECDMLVWGDPALDEFCFADEIGVGVIEEAQFNQLDRVESRLNLDILFHKVPGKQDDKDTYLQEMENSNLSGDPYDVVSAYSGIGAVAAMRGILVNLSKADYIEFSKPWWPKDLQNSVAVNGNLFFASGDISPNVIYGLFAIITNMDLWEDYYGATLGSTYLYDLVKEGTWTLEEMMRLSTDIYTDIGNVGKKDDSDLFGFVFSNTVSIDAFLQGCGIDITTRDANGKLVMSDSFFSEQCVNLVDKMGDFWAADYVMCSSDYAGIFPEGRALFMDAKIEVCITKLSDKEIEYAALPIPKYDTNQKNYITTMNHNFSVFGILNQLGESDISCAAAVLEALASEAYRTVSPAIFEKAFRLRYSANSDISQMYQYVRDGLKFDMGRLYRLNFTSNIPDTLFRNAVRANSGWATVISNKGKWNRTLTEISNSLDKLS